MKVCVIHIVVLDMSIYKYRLASSILYGDVVLAKNLFIFIHEQYVFKRMKKAKLVHINQRDFRQWESIESKEKKNIYKEKKSKYTNGIKFFD